MQLSTRTPRARLLLIALALILFPIALRSVSSRGPAVASDDANPWPAIRKQRIAKLLPEAMKRAGVDAWVTICRENANDPLALHVGGENAGGAVAFVFFLRGDKAESLVVTPPGEAQSLAETKLHDRYVVLEPGASMWETLGQELRAAKPKKIAVNSANIVMADGLSTTQRKQLESALGPDLTSRLVSSEDLVVEWLSVKLPEEVEILRKAAALTHQIEMEAFARVIPGKSRDADMSAFIKRRMKELGVTDSWAPDQNPNFNSDFDRGHSGATEKVILPGDVIQLDFGIKVHGMYCTDVQRFAYVLKPGETKAPADVQRYWESAKRGSRVALAAMKPGVRGWDVDKAQRDWMKQAGSLWVMWGTGHPVGFWAHDVGPSLSGAQNDRPASGGNARMLRAGQTFAFDGFFKWEWELRGKKGFKTISVEEMAVVTETGAVYLNPPQEELVLIAGRKR